MNSSRARTLATLDAFLDSQRQLLARTQSDLHKLTELRERALEDPGAFIENVEEELDDPAFRMSEYVPPEKPEGIDWSLFSSLDPSPFMAIPVPGPTPVSAATKQLSAPSELQKFVRETSQRILADFKPFVPNEEDVEAGVEADAADSQRLTELVRLGKRTDGPAQNVEMEVDEPEPRRTRVGSGLRLKPSREALDADPTVDTSSKGKGKLGARDKVQVVQSSQQRPKRSRRPTVRPDEIYRSPPPLLPPPPSPPDTELPPLPDAVFGSDVPMPLERHDILSDSDSNSHADLDGDMETTPKSRANAKPKTRQDTRRRKAPSETFNLPWSLSEQHLLEKLLEEIPSGEKQRWAKISKAMAGRRTPRQVASRVQKYFEKLKKFGVDPD